jgi:hypothetical protein
VSAENVQAARCGYFSSSGRVVLMSAELKTIDLKRVEEMEEML